MAVDEIGFPLAARLAECLCGLLAERDPVACCCVQPGSEVAWDDCTGGQAWVRIVNEYHVGDRFPNPQNTASPCGGVGGWAVVLELGVLRCMPQPDSMANLPSCSAVQDVAYRIAADKQTMREAIYCCDWREPARNTWQEDGAGLVVGGWNPVGPEGGCVGGVMTVTVHATGCICGERR